MDNHHLTCASTPLKNMKTPPLGGNSQWVAMGTAFITLAIASMSWQPAAANIRSGQSGAEVNYIQSCLKKLGYFQGPVTGNFGSKTENAVRRFQQATGINPIGVVGPQTQQALQRRCRTSASKNQPSRTSPSKNRPSRTSPPRNQPSRTPPSNNQPNNPPSNLLQTGASGDAVIRLQQDLQRLGFYRGAITGNFQDMTLVAVQQFQQSQGLPADGIVGVRTQRAITASLNNNNQPQLPRPQNPGSADPFPNALNQGDAGNRVVELQRALQQLRYFNSRLTGIFGDETRDAVARFQQDYKLIPNGVADAQTIAAISQALDRLYSSCTPGRGDMCLGENSQRVTAVQKRLQEKGFLGGKPTGYFDPATSAAVAQFQRASGLNPTGFVDARTFQALGLTSSNAQNRYVVVVPLKDKDTLSRVRQLVPQAFQAESRLGIYVNAGSFRDRSDAEKVSRMLRSQGFDARVEYF